MSEESLDSNFGSLAGPLGHIIIEFNYLEVDAGRMIARLLRQDDMVAAAFAAVLTFSQKISFIETILPLKVHNAELRNKIGEAIKEAKRVNSERNRFVHAEYWPVLSPNDAVKETLHRKLRDGAKTFSDKDIYDDMRKLLQPVDAARLAKIATDVNSLALRFGSLAEEFIDSNPR
jgi:hypothetical protein